jgi:glycerophosphoryl diester phosphodiesterase
MITRQVPVVLSLTTVISLPSLVTPGGGDRLLRPPSAAACAAPNVISHRGDQDGGTENTLGALRAALAAGSGQVELDIHFTKDHHAVLMHDATVDRTTNGTGRISDMTLARFRALRTPDGQHPPTLGGALALVADAGAQVLVELKQVPDALDLRSLRRDYQLLDAYRWAGLMSFSTAALNAVRSIPAVKGLLSESAPSTSAAERWSFVGVRYDNLTRSRVRAYLNAGVPVYAWTPNDRGAWRRLATYGVSRVVTDRTPAYLAWARGTCGA